MEVRVQPSNVLQVTENRGWGFCSYHCGLHGGVQHSTKLMETLVRWVLGELGPGQLGPGQLGPGLLGPGQLGPGAQLSTAKNSLVQA